jgi:hypothetical protein
MLAAALLGGTALTMGVAPAGASTLGGTATIANPSNNTALPSGGSTTTFTVNLPAGAACDGDTATGGYHVYSFLVQAGTDITSATFNNFPSQGYGFVDNTGTYYGPANTAINTGQIISIPTNFQWGPLVVSDGGALALSDLLYSGTSGDWDAGLVCANSSGHVADYWTTPVLFTASNSDPNGFTWTSGPRSSTPEAPVALMLPVIGAAAAVFVLMRKRRQRHPEVAAVDAA